MILGINFYLVPNTIGQREITELEWKWCATAVSMQMHRTKFKFGISDYRRSAMGFKF